MEWIAVVDAGANVVIAGVTTLAAVYAYKQWKDAQRTTIAQLRPYVRVEYVVENSRGPSGVWLQFENDGQSAAHDIRLCFADPQASWRTSGNTNFPFLPENGGISILRPGRRLRYFVGSWEVDSPLQGLSTSAVSATVAYRAAEEVSGGVLSDECELTLRDYRGTGLLKASKRQQGEEHLSSSAR